MLHNSSIQSARLYHFDQSLAGAFNTTHAEHHQQFRPYLTQLFGELTDAQLNQVFSVAQILHFETGQFVFQQGDTDNALYIVLSGRLRVVQQTETGTHILGDVAAGEPVGEFALFTNDPRTASVVAIRGSLVLQIDEADYRTIVAENPQFAYKLPQFVINRMRRKSFQHQLGAAPKNVAVIKLQADKDFSGWTNDIKQELAAMDTPVTVYEAKDYLFADQHAMFEEMENSAGMNILLCDEANPTWANECLTYCDLVVVATEFYAPSSLYSIEEKLNIYSKNILNKKIYLLLLHPENAPLPSQTRRWLEERPVNLHLHMRQGNARDIRRFCRILTHQAVGLVLGGGGAKGAAHIGAAKAMMEAGLEFDFVGGTSAGALYGMGLTVTDFDLPKVRDFCQMGVDCKVTSSDYHFPFLSLMTGKNMRTYLKQMLGDVHLEDFWINTYCVSTNYSSACVKVHDTGLARQKVEASIAIPGVFPPVIIDRHLHVDGGVLDNLPIEAMYEKPVRHVIAIALSAQSPRLVDIKTIPSAWDIFLNIFTKKHRYRLPKMPALLMNSLTLNSVQKQENTKKQVSMYLEMDLRSYGLLDWQKWREVIEKGYQQTCAFLENMPQAERFWK
ncbi:MAG: cyclic nucleotide-binding and patatin-like phospholipase domain-containing protein [Saprospiraceae bacterium]|nr:cyclic nucleotide-binding and patatin-like phospholipase domain-containing protein [Saprospiraceae bacterium]